MNIEDLRPAPYNPRQISEEAMAGLRASLKEFGDISGIVWNRRTGNIIAGHQRLKALGECKMDGETVVAADGGRFPVRVVDWPEAKEKAANIAANSPLLAGDFTADLGPLLDELKLELPDLSEVLRLEELTIPEGEPEAPEEFASIDESLSTEHECPKCGYKWSGGK